MKTPHRIDLITEERTAYNPRTGEHEELTKLVNRNIPCLINYISQAKVFEMYGDRNNRVIVARFMQEQAPFVKAEWQGRTFVPIETIDAPIKGSIRLKEVAD